jgi:hypothetical protein
MSAPRAGGKYAPNLAIVACSVPMVPSTVPQSNVKRWRPNPRSPRLSDDALATDDETFLRRLLALNLARAG